MWKHQEFVLSPFPFAAVVNIVNKLVNELLHAEDLVCEWTKLWMQ